MSNVILNNSILAIYGLCLLKPSEIVDKSLKIIQLIIKNAARLILGNFGIVGFLFFGRIPVDSSHFSLHFESIFYVERFKALFNPSVRTNWRPTEECSVLNIQ
jgi:hypothetical protein